MLFRSLGAATAAAALLSAMPAFAQDADLVPLSVDGTAVQVSVAVAADACGLPEENVRAQMMAASGSGFTQESTVDLADPSTADSSTLNDPMADADQDMNADVAATTEVEGSPTASSLAEPSTADQATLNEPMADADQDMVQDEAAGDMAAATTSDAAPPVITAVCEITMNRANELGIQMN